MADTFAQRMAAVMQDVGTVAKDKRNSHHGYDYTSATAVQAAVQKAMARHGLYFSSVAFEPIGEVSGKGAVLRCAVTVTDGKESAVAHGLGSGKDSLDKAPMKAQTASAKYALCALFCIPMGDDPEADHEADRRAHEPAKPAPVDADRAWYESTGKAAAERWLRDAAEVSGDPRTVSLFRAEIAQWLGEQEISKRGEALRGWVRGRVAKALEMAGTPEAERIAGELVP